MKFDSNSVNELTETELEAVYGGVDGWGLSSSSAAASSVTRVHSFSVLCDINVFSVKANVIAIDQLIGILSPHTQICANCD